VIMTAPHRAYLESVLACRCPRCREGKLFVYSVGWRFRKNMQMYERCPVCSQPTDIEVGFYYGTGYVSYLLGLVLTGISFITWLLIVGFSFGDSRFFVWLGLNSVLLIVIQPWLMRFSRALWLSFFVGYDPEWSHNPPQEPERQNESEKNNW